MIKSSLETTSSFLLLDSYHSPNNLAKGEVAAVVEVVEGDVALDEVGSVVAGLVEEEVAVVPGEAFEVPLEAAVVVGFAVETGQVSVDATE